MAVVTRLSAELEARADINGRPDFANPKLGVTEAKRFPPYILSVSKSASLMHHVLSVELQWYGVSQGGHALVRMQKPVAVAKTRCGAFFRLSCHRVRTCTVPSPESILCKACEAKGRNFPRRLNGREVDTGLTRTEASVRLGCLVNGY